MAPGFSMTPYKKGKRFAAATANGLIIEESMLGEKGKSPQRPRDGMIAVVIDTFQGGRTMRHTMRHVIPLFTDLLTVGLAILLLPALASRFQDFSFMNSVLAGLFFLIFGLAAYGIKTLRPATDDRPPLAFLLERRPLSALAVFFSLALMLAVAYVAGFLDSVVDINRGLLDEPSVTVYLLLTPASWFGLSLIYMLVITVETEPKVAPGTGRRAFVSFLALTGVNLMAIMFTAVLQAVAARFGPVANGLLFTAIIFVLYLLLFGPPRLLFFARQRSWTAVVTFLPLLALLAWLAIRPG